jgi:hypothetical protein
MVRCPCSVSRVGVGRGVNVDIAVKLIMSTTSCRIIEMCTTLRWAHTCAHICALSSSVTEAQATSHLQIKFLLSGECVSNNIYTCLSVHVCVFSQHRTQCVGVVDEAQQRQQQLVVSHVFLPAPALIHQRTTVTNTASA